METPGKPIDQASRESMLGFPARYGDGMSQGGEVVAPADMVVDVIARTKVRVATAPKAGRGFSQATLRRIR